jgi:hypothetical protein
MLTAPRVPAAAPVPADSRASRARRYAHLAVGHLAVYADALKIHGTILAQLPAPQKLIDTLSIRNLKIFW